MLAGSWLRPYPAGLLKGHCSRRHKKYLYSVKPVLREVMDKFMERSVLSIHVETLNATRGVTMVALMQRGGFNIQDSLLFMAFPLALYFSGCSTVPPKVKVIQNNDASQIYEFPNGRTCHKKADYTQYSKTEATAQIKDILQGKYSAEEKFENAKKREPRMEEVDAALFDTCYEYGEERLSENEYKSGRQAYDKFRQYHVGSKSIDSSAQTASRGSMVMVPAGNFVMGSSKDEIKKLHEAVKTIHPRTQLWWFEDELPRHPRNMGTFWIDKFEVTNAQFSTFLNSPEGESIDKPRVWENRTPPSGKQNHPVSSVDRFQANAYCRSLGKRLATESEWEKAARGPDGRLYPWGNEFNAKAVNTAEMGMHGTGEVGSMKDDVSYYGVYDMAGNVMELVLGENSNHQGYYGYPGNDADSFEANDAFKKREGWTIVRGGSFDSLFFDSRGANRRYFSPNHRGTDIGFRCTSD